MKFLIYIYHILLSINIFFSPTAIASQDTFNFVFQEVYNSKVTLSRVESMFNGISPIVNKSVLFSGSPNIEGIQNKIKNNELDLLIWGYSKKLDHYMKLKGYEVIAAANMDISLYEYKYGLKRNKDNPYKVGVMEDSAAHFIALSYFKKVDSNAELITYKNYFSIIQASFKKEIHMVAAAPSFLIPQPNTVQDKFLKVINIPVKTQISIWIKSNLTSNRKTELFSYFKSKEVYLSNTAGTGAFFRPKSDPN